MEELSKNLSVAEVIKSNTATYNGIDNSPSPEHLENLKAFAEVIFQPMRDALGPISISSGYRSEALNNAIKGASKTSQHSKGEALDLDNDFKEGRATNTEIFEYVRENLDFDQLIWEYGTKEKPDWVHVSYKKDGGNRGEILRCKRVNGKPKYYNYED